MSELVWWLQKGCNGMVIIDVHISQIYIQNLGPWKILFVFIGFFCNIYCKIIKWRANKYKLRFRKWLIIYIEICKLIAISATVVSQMAWLAKLYLNLILFNKVLYTHTVCVSHFCRYILYPRNKSHVGR